MKWKIIMDTFLPWQGKCNTITLAAVPKQIFMTAMWTKLLLALAQKSILAPLLPFLMRMWNIWICFQLVFVKTQFISFFYLNFVFCVKFDLPESNYSPLWSFISPKWFYVDKLHEIQQEIQRSYSQRYWNKLLLCNEKNISSNFNFSRMTI